MTRTRVAFFRRYAFHRAMLDDPYRLCADHPELDAVWIEDENDLPDAGAAIIVYADQVPEPIRAKLPARTLYVFTRHGFSTKNYLAACLHQSDVTCLSSPAVERSLRRGFTGPQLGYWVTGFTATDLLWRQSRQPRPATGESGGGTTVVLYAPTWNADGSAHPVIGTQWMGEWLAGGADRRLIVKPHPHLGLRQPEWMQELQLAAAQFPDALSLVDADANIYELLARADALISDTSSVLFYYLSLDRPVVLVDPHRIRMRTPRLDRSGPEWRWRDIGPRVQHADQVLPALGTALANPDSHAAARRRRRAHVFGELFDGRASERLVAHLAEAARNPTAWPQDPNRHRYRKPGLLTRARRWLAQQTLWE